MSQALDQAMSQALDQGMSQALGQVMNQALDQVLLQCKFDFVLNKVRTQIFRKYSFNQELMHFILLNTLYPCPPIPLKLLQALQLPYNCPL